MEWPCCPKSLLKNLDPAGLDPVGPGGTRLDLAGRSALELLKEGFSMLEA